MVSVNGQSLSGEKVSKITLDGKMTVVSTVELPRNAKAELTRIIFRQSPARLFMRSISFGIQARPLWQWRSPSRMP